MDISNTVVEFIISNLISILFGIVGVAGFIFSIFGYFKSKNRKEITWERISVTPVKGLRGARLITLQLKNSGNVRIIESDYRKPLKFNFGKEAKVANVAVVNTKPPGLKEVADKSFRPDPEDLNKIMIAPFLFNANYAVTFTVQVTKFKGEIEVENSTSVVDVYDVFEIKPLAESSKGKLLLSSIVFILVGQGSALVLQLLYQPYYRFGLIGATLITCSTLFLRSFSPTVFANNIYGWHYKIKTFKSLFWVWTKFSIIITIVILIIQIPFILLVLLFGTPS